MSNEEIELLYDIPELYPPVSELMEALQEEGKPSEDKNGRKLLTHKAIQKFSKNLHNKLVERNIRVMDANVTRSAKRITCYIVTLRKHVDITSVLPALQKYGKRSKENKMFVIQNIASHAGYPLILKMISAFINDNIVSSGSNRTPNDGLRVCGIILHEKYRGAVSALMRNQKGRPACDLPDDPIMNFANEAVNDFKDQDFEVQNHPDTNLIEGYENMDANDPERIDQERDGKWFWNTWAEYVKPKYRLALSMWYQQTGGGDGTPPSFQLYCPTAKWLTWIFLLDDDQGGLLSGNASSRVPTDVVNEPGIGEDGNDNDGKPSSNRKNDPLAKRNNTTQQMDGVTDSAHKMIYMATEMISKTSDRQQQHAVLSPRTEAQEKLEYLNKRIKLVTNDTAFPQELKDKIIRETNLEKMPLGRILAGLDDEVVCRVLPFDRLHQSSVAAHHAPTMNQSSTPTMNQSSMMHDFEAYSDDK